MNNMALLGIVALLYAIVVLVLAIKKPKKIWKMKKIKMFEKILGKKGTIIFFYIWATLVAVLGIWLMTLK